MVNTTNFNDPLNTHPSDTTGNLVNEQLIGLENYGIWSRVMLIALCVMNKLDFIEGTCRRPDVGHIKLHQWEK